MRHSTSNFFYLCAIFIVCTVAVTQNMKANEKKSMLKSWSANATKKNSHGWKNNASYRSNRRPKKCDTPNSKPGYCIGIKRCPSLLKQVKNKQAWEFLLACRCESTNKFSNNPKVCCEIDNFRNLVSKNITHEVLPKSCGHQKVTIRNRIFGGRAAFPHEYPWMALLLHRNYYDVVTLGCAGFLIHSKYVLTAAHCTHPDSFRYKGPIVSVLLGKHNIETSSSCASDGFGCGKDTQIHKIAKVTTHPQYDSTSTERYNDIAIIQLKDKVNLTDYVQPICLAKGDAQIPTSYHVSGWGKTESGTKSKVKMQVEIPPFNKSTCFQRYLMADIILRDTQTCAGGEELSDTCSGDSGGPLMFTEDEIWYASGIVSFGMGCGMKGWPGVYTNIVKFLPWIKSVIAQEQK